LYNPTNLPVWGTKTISDLPGEITSPISGATFTWSNSAAAVSTVIIAASVAQGVTLTAGGSSSTTKVGSSVAGATGGATGTTGSSGSASPTSQKGDAQAVTSQPAMLAVVVFVFACAVVI
jgi:hypothetical protein